MNPARIVVHLQTGTMTNELGHELKYHQWTGWRCLDCGTTWRPFHPWTTRDADHWCPAAEHPMYAAAKAEAPQPTPAGGFRVHLHPGAPWFLKKWERIVERELVRVLAMAQRARPDLRVYAWGSP
jgi:hypothetical protein